MTSPSIATDAYPPERRRIIRAAFILLCAAATLGLTAAYVAGLLSGGGFVEQSLGEAPKSLTRSNGRLADISVSPQWKHVAVKLRVSSKESYLVIDGQRHGPYEGVGAIIWGPEGDGIACMVQRDQKYFAWINGQEYPDITTIEGIAISRDGQRWAVPSARPPVRPGAALVRTALKCDRLVYRDGGKWVIENEPFKDYHEMPHLLVTEDGRTMAFFNYESVAQPKPDTRLVLVTNGQAREYKYGCNAVMSRNNQRIAFMAFREGKVHVVVDGQEGPAYDTARSIQFSRDGKHCFYQAIRRQRDQNIFVLVIDGKEVAEADKEFQDPVFGEDGTSYAYWTGDATRRDIYFNGQRVKQFDAKTEPRTRIEPRLAISTDGKWLAVYLDAPEPVLYGRTGETWSGDSQARPELSFAQNRLLQPLQIKESGTKQQVFLNDEMLGEYDRVIDGPGPHRHYHLDKEARSARLYAVRNERVFRVDVKLPVSAMKPADAAVQANR